VSGLLVVNADDWGGDESSTDAILGAFEAGRITSASAMVYMPDSIRAAEIAKRVGLPVGLHLNLSEPFARADMPAAVRARQRRLAKRCAGTGPDGHPGISRTRRWCFDPRVSAEVDRVIADQIERFTALYGRAPTHFDGHNHVDVCPNVFRSGSIPAGAFLRGSVGRFPVDRSPMGLARSARHACRPRRLRSTDYLLHIAELSLPDSGPADPRLRLADESSVEVMGHPDDPGELAALMSPAWERVLGEHRLGSFADLAPAKA
jgi:predicted glycoside hydrolase/deacetylase ChbG (UPF0249 family)